MTRRLALAALVLPLLVGARFPACSPHRKVAVQIVSPSDNRTVRTSEVPIAIRIDPALIDAATLTARLNGEPVALEGGPGVFTATVGPGLPLLGFNQLVVRASSSRRPPQRVRVRRFGYDPPRASARRITRTDELIEGPLAHGQLGDLGSPRRASRPLSCVS